MKLLTIGLLALGVSLIVAISNADRMRRPSTNEYPRTSYVFRISINGQQPPRDLPAIIVRSYSPNTIPSKMWPFRSNIVTIICARTRLGAVVGPRDVLALNGWTSGFRDRGRVIGSNGEDLPIVGLSSTTEAKTSTLIDARATTEEINMATDDLLREIFEVDECR